MRIPIVKFRKSLFLFLTLAAFSAAPAQLKAPAAPEPVMPPPPSGIAALHDVVIGKGGTRDLHAEVAYPEKAAGLLPAVIYIHGGGWFKFSHKLAPIYEIARAGYFAVSVEYRLSGEAQWPAQIQDCKLGVRWLRANAAQYHVDPNHIGVWGDSAGGHLVDCVGTMADVKEYEGDGGYPGVSSAVQAVVDFFGPTDFTNPSQCNPGLVKMIEALMGAPHDQNPDLWKSASPVAYVKAGCPPVLMVHGDSDSLVSLAQSTVFDEALTKAGVPHQLMVVKNADHGFKPVPGTTINPSRAEIKKAAYDFFAKYLKTP